MNAELPRTVSEPTLKRLPLYHRFLKELLQREQEAVSCTNCGRILYYTRDMVLAGEE